jgi:hypothetical protein
MTKVVKSTSDATLEELKKARETLDRRVLKYIRKRAPLTRLMNLSRGVAIPPALWKASTVLNPCLRMERIIDGSLRRLKKVGKIWCNKSGTPFWEVVEGADG